ncbi:MAG: molecular chaperone TorD family protein [Desulfomicrobium sp.]|nr:molecular chaperone TorD family protein [Desulfomicrobium sp.]
MSEQCMPSIEALRDFFAATDAGDLEDAAVRIAKSVGVEIPPHTDWTTVEYEFNRLFVGPAAVSAPPFASAWSESDRALMGRATSEARQTYHRLGLAVPGEGVIPDDHLAYELEAMLVLKSVLATGAGAPDAETAALHAWFVGEHLERWLPPFMQAVREQATEGGVVALVTEALAAWFDNERNSTAALRPA